MAIHKIKAKDDTPAKKTEKPVAKSKTPPKKDQKPAKTNNKSVKATSKPAKKEQKTPKKGFILFRPFLVFGRYVRDSWREIRQVRWPDRKLTWKMTGAVVVYVLIFAAVIISSSCRASSAGPFFLIRIFHPPVSPWTVISSWIDNITKYGSLVNRILASNML